MTLYMISITVSFGGQEMNSHLATEPSNVDILKMALFSYTYVCMYVCMCVCVCASELTFEGTKKKKIQKYSFY